MLNLAPQPDWRPFLLALLGQRNATPDWQRHWQSGAEDVVGFLSRSAWSLALVALWRRELDRGRQICVWVPDYYCNSSLEPLRRLDVRLHFYPVTDELAPNYVKCREQARQFTPDLFVHVHYFGRPVPASRTREFCNHHGAWLIEDAAHVLCPIGDVGKEGDFVLYSPHKLLAMPAGAVLVVRPDGSSRLGKEMLRCLGAPPTWPRQLAAWDTGYKWMQRVRAGGAAWVVKRLLQKLGVRSRPSAQPFDDTYPPAPVVLPSPTVSIYAIRLLALAVPRLTEVARWRERNLMLMDELLSDRADLRLIPVMHPGGQKWVPYIASYEAPNAEAAYLVMRQSGLPAATWPDLPPEVVAQPKEHSVAIRLRAQRIYLPIHQSLRASTLFRGLASATSPTNRNVVKIGWNTWDRQQWDEWMRLAETSNLLQSWSYGEAKAVVGGWKVRRGVIFGPQGPLACVQVLQKQVGGLMTMTRINRGPLFFHDTSPELRAAALLALSRTLGGWYKGHVLSWAPELALNGRSLVMLEQCGVRQFSTNSWETSLIDLHQDEIQLRTQLAGRWRNMLTIAQRQEVIVECLNDETSFEVLLMHCLDMLRGKQVNFPADLYRELRRQLILAQTPGMLLAIRAGGEIISAIWVVRHGNTATYLLGWSGTQGRRWNAHYLLLWDAMLRLKRLGVNGFDTGGIDDENTSGIAAFKLGLGGVRCSLVGEGWCY
ncbi:MAG: GNAT family N-acetyltransferase [Gammaproteobacteria bacterium]|nr:GNAT family N-acetyltransferase [Gammaproteobacteria bacterium]MBU0788323.1 GNAT family N-acetyltransferase [Gammaproteobacteria bacterium]MBU0815180.1 GNAT family N-acetyltransferase [Gammaproteobacteria bacterium]MBU1785712.1 GNAT family N-acetyltransferase [Gammaproteobacteria bacterium]